MDELLLSLQAAFLKPLPGWEAQQKMLNYLRPQVHEAMRIDPGARKGAVLVLLYPKGNELYTVLTLRHPYPGTHGGQVSFPGGKPELFDADLWHTALREAQEEIGFEHKALQPIGMLTEVYIPPSRYLVSPYIAFVPYAPVFTADPVEVARIIETPVSAILDESLINEKKIHVQVVNATMNVKYFDIDGETVWGATAMMLSELAEIFRRERISLLIK
jgi:8-oxo-dGTP pyrophosphatase MutT (NUDIX family)